MKAIDYEEAKYKKETIKERLFVIVAFIFALIATFTKIDSVKTVILIIVSSILISMVLSLILVKAKNRTQKLSVVALFTLGYVVPKLFWRTIESRFLEYLFLWIAIEMLAFLFLLHPRLEPKIKETKRDTIS
jgi:hypothetical protein